MQNKILVTTVDCWNSKMGSNTMETFLSNYPRELIANIFIRAGRPDSSVCNNFLQIVENKVISSIFRRNTKTCLRMSSTSLSESSDSILDNDSKVEGNRYRFFRRYRFWIFLYIREILWWMGNWKSDDLNNFIDEFNPDILFFPIEGYIHFNRLNEYIIKKTGKRAIAVVWDDVFTYKTSYNPLSIIYRYFCRKSIKRLLNSCEKIYCLNPKLKNEFEYHFNVVTTIIHKPIDYSNTMIDFSIPKETLKFIYAGNLLIDRDKTIISLIKSINKVNKDSTKIELDIFSTSEVSRKLKKTLSNSKQCNVHNPISNNELTEVLKRYDVLLFVEALKGRYKNAARLSFSTKFADYLKLSRCILAIGSKNIAPIEYLEEHNAACIITDEKQIYDTLLTLISNKNLLNDYALASYQTGFYNHNKERVQMELYNQFDSFL